MRRGFKSWCERCSVEYRETLGIPLAGALDPRKLAALLRVHVLVPEELPALAPSSLKQLTETDVGSWSAVTISQSGRMLIILNSGHSIVRQKSSLAHELAHIILNHTTTQVQLSREGFLIRTTFDKEQEQEAEWLSGCLLVPREGLLQVCRRATQSPYTLAQHFAVSRDLINWRLRMTGVQNQVRRYTPLSHKKRM